MQNRLPEPFNTASHITTVTDTSLVANVFELQPQERSESAFTFWRWLAVPNTRRSTRAMKTNHIGALLRLLEKVAAEVAADRRALPCCTTWVVKNYPSRDDSAVVYAERFGDVRLTIHETTSRWFLLQRVLPQSTELAITFCASHIPLLAEAANAARLRLADSD